MRIQTETKIVEFIKFDGIKFYKDNKGYWLSSKINGKPVRLHIYVWEKYNGKVPKGYHVHHIDHDTNNNYIENLMLMEKYEHLSYHASLQDKCKLRDNLNTYARPKAIEWHKSEKAKEWHMKHYLKMKDKLHKRIVIVCEVCKKEKEVGFGGCGNRFCSNKCKSQYRRNAGVDNVIRKCEVCGEEFDINKYSSRRFCSKECRGVNRNENKKNRAN